jgi:hypothetical protein|tara:strand:- start:3416 stop:3895 length:480 start_codon:yes stop_codon:yes gene_type:complete
MATNYQTTIYQPQLEKAHAYQDFVARRLLDEGIVLVGYQSRQAQFDIGENALGLEIKCDDKLAKLGNVYIEIQEKSDPSNAEYVASGIHRPDNSWLYGIGDYHEFFIFSKRTLRLAEKHGKFRLVENEWKTSRGFLIPRLQATQIAERLFAWDQKEVAA